MSGITRVVRYRLVRSEAYIAGESDHRSVSSTLRVWNRHAEPSQQLHGYANVCNEDVADEWLRIGIEKSLLDAAESRGHISQHCRAQRFARVAIQARWHIDSDLVGQCIIDFVNHLRWCAADFTIKAGAEDCIDYQITAFEEAEQIERIIKIDQLDANCTGNLSVSSCIAFFVRVVDGQYSRPIASIAQVACDGKPVAAIVATATNDRNIPRRIELANDLADTPRSIFHENQAGHVILINRSTVDSSSSFAAEDQLLRIDSILAHATMVARPRNFARLNSCEVIDSWIWQTAGWLISLALCGAGVYWAVAWLSIKRSLASIPSVRDSLLPATPDASPLPSPVVVIIPAHNEESSIAQCARSVLTQRYPDLRVIFVLDRCTDDTANRLRAEVADDPRVMIVENTHSPADWHGKCYAAHLGAQAAIESTDDEPSFILFVDADTRLHRDLISAAIARANHDHADLLSLLSTLTHEHWFEYIMQPAASMELLRIIPPNKMNTGSDGRYFANGQFMLFRTATYRSLGGHAAVKDHLLEDLAFARVINKSADKVQVCYDDGMLECSMYSNFRQFQKGWQRIFLEACKRRADRLRRYAWRAIGIVAIDGLARLLAVAMLLAIFVVGELPVALMAALVVTLALSTLLKFLALNRVRVRSHAPLRVIMFHSFGMLNVAYNLFIAARDLSKRKPVQWAGREYLPEPR